MVENTHGASSFLWILNLKLAQSLISYQTVLWVIFFKLFFLRKHEAAIENVIYRCSISFNFHALKT